MIVADVSNCMQMLVIKTIFYSTATCIDLHCPLPYVIVIKSSLMASPRSDGHNGRLDIHPNVGVVFNNGRSALSPLLFIETLFIE